MEERVTELLSSKNIDDFKLGVIMAREINYPIEDLNYYIGKSCSFPGNYYFLQQYTDFDFDNA